MEGSILSSGQGYGLEHDEWLHEGKLKHAKDVLKNYNKANGLL